MSVDKAYSLALKQGNHDKAAEFSKNMPVSTISPFSFYLGYEAGQKTLSPEVREVLKNFEWFLLTVESGIKNGFPKDIVKRIAYSKNKIEKLLEAGE